MKELDEIISIAKSAKEDADKAKDNKKAGIRFRRDLLKIKDLAHQLRLASLGKTEN